MFKEKFKYYKSKSPPPNLQEVIDFSKIKNAVNKVKRIIISNNNVPTEKLLEVGLKEANQWDVFCLDERPGLRFVRNPFLPIGQRYWIKRCLENYTSKPNQLNLDALGVLKSDENWWSSCQSNNIQSSELLHKLRWATLGYHHNWNTKVYSENFKNDFPEDLAKLSNIISTVVCEYPQFTAQAAIINFYHMASTLSGHKDRSEINMHAPLLSFSFGQSAIFLVGGVTLDENPTALFLHSGDIVIMQEDARLAYHGVPRIVSNSDKPWLEDRLDCHLNLCCEVLSDIKTWEPFDNYVSSSRINMNVRQVLLPGQTEIHT